jgi:di/tricarboxylate transporter
MPHFPSSHALAAMIVAGAMFYAFARGRIANEIVSLSVIAVIALGLYFMPLPGARPEHGLALVFSGFGHPALVTICALMVMGRGLVMTGALEPIVNGLSAVWRLSGPLGLLAALALAFGLSMMINDTPVLVLLLPVLVQLAGQGAMPSSKTLMPVNCAVLIGGMATTIGTSTNLLVVSIARDLGLPAMSVFHFTPIVLAAAVVALPYLWLVAPRLLPDNSVQQVRAERRFAAMLRVGGGSELVGARIADLVGRMPADFAFSANAPDVIEANARIEVSGTHEALEQVARRFASTLAPAWLIEQLHYTANRTSEDVVVVELAVTADSPLAGKSIPEAAVSQRYGVAILGVHFAPRRAGFGPSPGVDSALAEGDVLLVMATMPGVQAFARAESLLQLDGAKTVPRRSKALLALAIMISAVASASIGLLPIAIAALGGAIAMFVTGCVRFANVGRALSAQVIVLVAASIAVGRLILESGAAAWLGQVLALVLQFLPPAGVLAAMMAFVAILTNFASNTAAATVSTPIAFNVATSLNMPPEPLVLAVLFGCNLCYATPIAYQTNMLIMAEGDYWFGDYVRVGLPLILIMVVSLSILLVLRYGI